jgi:DNA polymerase-1
MSKNNIAIIDGSYYVYKFYHALKSLRTSKSYPTGAIYGFIKFINSFEKKYPFELLLVVFDAPVKTFKSSKCNLYKSNRRAINYELYFQFKIIFEFCELIGLKSYLINGYEADDVIADLTRQYTNIGYKVFILSGDKD